MKIGCEVWRTRNTPRFDTTHYYRLSFLNIGEMPLNAVISKFRAIPRDAVKPFVVEGYYVRNMGLRRPEPS
jgi:hypothetical protein